MKKILAISLFLILLLKIGGLVAFLSIERELVREAMILKIVNYQNVNNLTCIIDNKKMAWEEKEQEFWYNNKLYDVVKIEILNNQKHYYCLADDDETELVAVIKNLIQNQDSPLSKTTKNIISWFFQTLILPKIDELLFGYHRFGGTLKSFFLHSHYIFDGCYKTIKPPIAI